VCRLLLVGNFVDLVVCKLFCALCRWLCCGGCVQVVIHANDLCADGFVQLVIYVGGSFEMAVCIAVVGSVQIVV
jgi:hypothetical protein